MTAIPLSLYLPVTGSLPIPPRPCTIVPSRPVALKDDRAMTSLRMNGKWIIVRHRATYEDDSRYHCQ